MVEFLLFPFKAIAWILSIPLNSFAFLVQKFQKPYDPERAVCPGCGFRGNDGGPVCRVETVRVTAGMGAEPAMLEHDCLRCSALYYSNTYRKASEWMPQMTQDLAARIREAAAKKVL